MEMRNEDKIIGNVLSLRQFMCLGAGLAVGAGFGFVIFKMVSLFTNSVPLIMALAVAPMPFSLGVGALFAFAPAGWAGILPGPKHPTSPDPWDPPMRLDQWLRVMRCFQKKPKYLPYVRDGYKSKPSYLFRDDANRGGRK